MGTDRRWLALISLLLLTGCGGQMQTGESNVPQPEPSLQALLPALATLDSANESGEIMMRRAQAAFGESISGSDYWLKSGNATVDADSLNLLPGSREISWGIYGIQDMPGLLDGILISGDSLGGGVFYVAIANYARGRWDFHMAPQNADNYHLGNLDWQASAFRSPEGNVYAAVIAWDLDDYRVNTIRFEWESELPVPVNVTASDAASETEVAVSWEFAGEADAFSIQRSPAEGGPYEVIAEVPAVQRDFVDVYDLETNDFPSDAVWYRVAVVSEGQTGLYSLADQGSLDFIFLITDLKGGCNFTQEGAEITWSLEWIFEYVQIYRDSPDNLIAEVDVQEIDVFTAHYVDTSASMTHAHKYWVRPVMGGRAGPKVGPVTAARAVWQDVMLEDNGNHDEWGLINDTTHIGGLPAIAMLAAKGPGPGQQDAVYYARSSQLHPEAAEDIAFSPALIITWGSLGGDVELTEFEGRPLIFYSSAAGALHYLYAKTPQPDGPSDWNSGMAVSSGFGQENIELLDYAGTPVVCFMNEVTSSVSVCFVSAETNGLLLFGITPVELSTYADPQISIVDGRLGVMYQRGTDEELTLAVAESSNLSSQMEWELSSLGNVTGFQSFELLSIEGSPAVFFEADESTSRIELLIGKKNQPQNPSEWMEWGITLIGGIIEESHSTFNCLGHPLFVCRRPDGSLSCINTRFEENVDGSFWIFDQTEALDGFSSLPGAYAVDFYEGNASIVFNAGAEGQGLRFAKVRKMLPPPD